MSNITFKKLTSSKDWEIVLLLENIASKNSPYYLAFTNLDDLKKFVGNSIVYLVFENEKPVGHVEYEIKKEGNIAEITGFVLVPEARGKGLGKKLFEKAMNDLQNMKMIFLMTHPENSAALKVYLSFGFKIKGWYDNFYKNNQPRLRLEKINNNLS